MKYVVVLGDGMADLPNKSIEDKTPLDVANKPCIDSLALKSEIALCNTIPYGMSPGSDTANLSVMGYDPNIYYTGRAPLEAVSMGIEMSSTEVCYRCNLVTLSEDEPYNQKVMIDHSASEITTEASRELLEVIDRAFSDSVKKFHPGVSYRHALVWKDGSTEVTLVPPHNILGQKITQYLPKGDHAKIIDDFQRQSYKLLNNHPINITRAKKGLNKANSIWIWGEGTPPKLTSFEEKYGLKGAMISAVDLLKGIALSAGMLSIDVPGANGTINTNYAGKVTACLEALRGGSDFVYLHIEAPDECGHQGNIKEKIRSIELLDQKVVKPLIKGLTDMGDDYRLLIMPDHPTPVALRTHTSDPVPYLLYDSRKDIDSGLTYSEAMATRAGVKFKEGHDLMGYFVEQKK